MRAALRQYSHAIVMLFGAFLPAVAWAQSTVHYIKLADVEQIPGSTQKHILELIASLDVTSKASFQQEEVKIKLAYTIAPDALLAELNALQLGTFVYVDRPDRTFPLHTMSGDASDHQQAKQAWIEQHPDRYLQMTGADSSGNKEAIRDR